MKERLRIQIDGAVISPGRQHCSIKHSQAGSGTDINGRAIGFENNLGADPNRLVCIYPQSAAVFVGLDHAAAVSHQAYRAFTVGLQGTTTIGPVNDNINQPIGFDPATVKHLFRHSQIDPISGNARIRSTCRPVDVGPTNLQRFTLYMDITGSPDIADNLHKATFQDGFVPQSGIKRRRRYGKLALAFEVADARPVTIRLQHHVGVERRLLKVADGHPVVRSLMANLHHGEAGAKGVHIPHGQVQKALIVPGGIIHTKPGLRGGADPVTSGFAVAPDDQFARTLHGIRAGSQIDIISMQNNGTQARGPDDPAAMGQSTALGSQAQIKHAAGSDQSPFPVIKAEVIRNGQIIRFTDNDIGMVRCAAVHNGQNCHIGVQRADQAPAV